MAIRLHHLASLRPSPSCSRPLFSSSCSSSETAGPESSAKETPPARAASAARNLLGHAWKILEGNVFNIVFLKRNAHKAGEDAHGNEYFENYDYPHLQQRWVKFKDEYSYNATQIPPEWHAWMHYLGDYAPHNADMSGAKYTVPMDNEGHNKTGTPRRYYQKGNWANPNSKPGAWGSREWRKYERWEPRQQVKTNE